jgi:anti-anti-sigma regulatory factor
VLKVTTTKERGGLTVLRLEGRLAESWVDEVARAAAAAADGGAPVIFDLEGLTFVDVRGVALLRGAAERGARLTGGSPFVAALIDQG